MVSHWNPNSSIPSKFIHETTFYKYCVDVPDKMRECADIPGVLDEEAFRHFKQDTEASLIRYDKDASQIIVLVCFSNIPIEINTVNRYF